MPHGPLVVTPVALLRPSGHAPLAGRRHSSLAPPPLLGRPRVRRRVGRTPPAYPGWPALSAGEHDLPFSTWSLSKLAEFLVAEGVVDDISHEGLRVLLREEGVSFQRLKTWKASRDPDYAVKKARIEHLYAIADREVIPEDSEPQVIFCVDLCRSWNYAEVRAA
jgi:hypothetical protein